MSKARRERQEQRRRGEWKEKTRFTNEEAALFTQEILVDLRGFRKVLSTYIDQGRVPWQAIQKLKDRMPALDYARMEPFAGKPLVLVPLPLELAQQLKDTLERAEWITAGHHLLARLADAATTPQTTQQTEQATKPELPPDSIGEMSQADRDRGRELQLLVARHYPSPREAIGAVACLLQHVAYDNALVQGNVSPGDGDRWAYQIAPKAQQCADFLCQNLATDAEQVYALGAILNGLACNIERG